MGIYNEIYVRGRDGHYIMDDPREVYMELHEIEREEAVDLINYYASHGRVKSALQGIRDEIIKHMETRPEKTCRYADLPEPPQILREALCGWTDLETPEQWIAWRDASAARVRDGFAAWLKELRELLAIRRDIPEIAAKALARLPSHEREKLGRFNEVFGGEKP
ncbi:MAG TPA: hypothetical protein VMV54_06080 [Acidocella sp.]|nr:hypothetical protein [Acidocella sp.]